MGTGEEMKSGERELCLEARVAAGKSRHLCAEQAAAGEESAVGVLPWALLVPCKANGTCCRNGVEGTSSILTVLYSVNTIKDQQSASQQQHLPKDLTVLLLGVCCAHIQMKQLQYYILEYRHA